MLGYTFENLGARGKGKKRKSARRKRGGGGTCRTGTVRFKTKRGKVVTFHGKSGPGCGPRKKSSTRHLAPYKSAMSRAAKACKGLKKNQFQSCVASAMHSGKARRRKRG
jgi:hypothetical protein